MDDDNSTQTMTTDADTTTDAGAQNTPPAEILVTNIWVNPTIIHQNEQITMGAECTNSGGTATGVFTARYTLDGSENNDIQWPNLNPGETYSQEWQHAAVTAGDHTFEVTFDYYNIVPENNKQDNYTSYGFSVLDYNA